MKECRAEEPLLEYCAPIVSSKNTKKRTKKREHGKPPAFLEFFAGSGLVAEAFEGLLVPVWANDNCEKKMAVYIANHGSGHFHHESIAHVSGATLPAASLAWASFPCQDLSLAGQAEGIHAPRSGLVWEWLRIIDEMPDTHRPPILVAENVAGLVSADEGAHYRILHEALIRRQYVAGAVLLDAVRWLPQSRPRVFVIAVSNDFPIPQQLTRTEPCWLQPESIVRAARGLKEWVWWSATQPPRCKKTIADIIDWEAPFPDADSEARNISLISRRHAEILKSLPTDKTLVAPGYKRTRAGKQVLELRFDGVAGCLRTPEGGSSRQLIVVRNNGKLRARLLTVREAARLMGAPETYKIPGSYNDGYKAMGDAVAVPVARWLAETLLLPLIRAADE